MAWWTDRNGNKIEYWDGNHPIGTEGCKCSLEARWGEFNHNGDSVSFRYIALFYFYSGDIVATNFGRRF